MELDAELTHVLEAVEEVTSPEALSALRAASARAAAGPDPDMFPAAKPGRQQQQEEEEQQPAYAGDLASSRRACVEDAIRERLGFSVRVRPSGISGAGAGAWVDGFAGAGAVVGIFPGTVFLPGQLLRGDSLLEWLYPDVSWWGREGRLGTACALPL